jgi:hypothetical protein
MASAGIRKSPSSRYKVWWRLDDASQGSQTFDTETKPVTSCTTCSPA